LQRANDKLQNTIKKEAELNKIIKEPWAHQERFEELLKTQQELQRQLTETPVEATPELAEETTTPKASTQQERVSPKHPILGDLGASSLEGKKGKPKDTISEVEKELGGEVDEVVGDVGLPVGQSVRIIGNIGSIIGKKRKSKASPHAFSDSGIEERYQASHGVQQENFWSKLREFSISLYNKLHREYEHLPRTAEFAQLRFDLNVLAKQKPIAGDRTLRLQQGITLELRNDPDAFDLFERKVILDDLAEEAKLGHELPFGFTEETLRNEKQLIDAEVDKNPKVKAAIAKRNKVWKAIKNDYIKAMKAIGFNVEDRLQKVNYYRHQILEYANVKGPSGTGKKLKTPTGRGFLKTREGSALDINTNYLEAEYEVMAQMLYDIQVAKTIKAVDMNYNIHDQLKRQAKAQNDSNIMPHFAAIAAQWNADAGPQAKKKYTAADAYRKILNAPIAIAFDKLSKMAANGQLPDANGKYAELITEMAEVSIANKPESITLSDESMNEIFRYAAYLLKEHSGTEPAKAAGALFKAINAKEGYIRQVLGKKYVTWEDIIPEGYTLWQPREGNVFFMANTIPEQVAEQLMMGLATQIGIKAEDLSRMVVMGGRRTQYVVKNEVALTLNNLVKERPQDPVARIFEKVLTGWKQYQLISPKRIVKYNFRNISGDAEGAFVGNPSTFKKVPQAITELYRVIYHDAAMTPLMKAWFERGGMQSTLQVLEMGDINRLRMFQDMVKAEGTAKELPLKAWQKYWKSARMATDFREAILRYAAFLDYVEQMQKNKGVPYNFGASIREEVMALDNIYDRAFKLSNDLLGAYDEVSVAGTWGARYFLPFWRWKEVNFKRYVRLMKNAAYDKKLAEATGRKLLATVARTPFIAIKVGMFALKAAAFWAMLQAYNMTRFPEEEKELSEDVRNKPHIIFGRDKDGKVLYFSQLGAIGDFLEWFGLEAPQQMVVDWLNGRKSIQDVALNMAKAPVNIVAQALGPHYKLPAEMAFGKKTFPNVFKPGTIRDRGLYLAQSLGLGDEYKKIAGLPSRNYMDTLKNIFVYTSDPGEGAYYDILDEKRAFQKKIGKYNEYTGSFSPRSQALYNIRMAIRYQDKKALEKYLIEYVNLGGTKQGLETSLRNMNPLHGLNKAEQKVFVKIWLDDEGREKLLLALAFYENVLLGKRREPETTEQ